MQQGIQFSKRFCLIYCLAWIPYSLSYSAVFLTQSNTDFTTLFFLICRNIIPASVLGIGVIWVCNRLNWSLHRKIWFLPIHLAIALVYSFIWMGILFLLLTADVYYQTGVWSLISFIGNALQWQLFSGIMIYSTIASIIYVLQVAQHLRYEERRAAQAETLYAQNALAALQAQLNPHFLFNTLHSLMALIRYKPEIAENALEKLSEMLRYSLFEKRDLGRQLVSLEDELKFVENYLDLEKLRLGERLSVQKQIESETLNCLLPAFTIQPLIENSIKHGITPKNISATIFISAKLIEDFLVLEISDDGIGSSNQKITKSNGLGVNLVREQLQIQYGEKSFFEIQTKPDDGFKVKMKIPIEHTQNLMKERMQIEYSHANS